MRFAYWQLFSRERPSDHKGDRRLRETLDPYANPTSEWPLPMVSTVRSGSSIAHRQLAQTNFPFT
jgi:hypothetical protein